MNTVDAVKTREDIDQVGSLLNKHFGGVYQDIWKFGINTALRISDLLSIRHTDVDDNKLVLKEQKTGKRREITLNTNALAIVERRRIARPNHEYLFQGESNRSSGTPLSRQIVSRRFKEVGDMVKIPLGTHSMRKTRGYAMWSSGVPIEKICKVLNHSHPAVTMDYLGITREDVQKTYEEFLL